MAKAPDNMTMPWRIIVSLVIVIAAVIGVAGLIAHGGKLANKNGLQVVAAENFYGDIAKQLGGERVQVASIISDPETDPHLYESSAKNAVEVGSADIVITNGVGYDDFMDKLLSGSKNSSRQVITAAKIFGVNDDNANPHLWYDLSKMNLIAQAITKSYEQKDPAYSSEYEHNLQTFDQSLQPLLATIGQIKRYYSGTPVAYTESVPGYLLQAASLSVRTPEGFAKSIEDGSDPSPADTTTMENLLTSKTARILFYNSQATSPVTEHVRTLAEQAGVPVIGVTETLPPKYKNYQAWQQGQLDQIMAALKTT